jgi:hypothetical protein
MLRFFRFGRFGLPGSFSGSSPFTPFLKFRSACPSEPPMAGNFPAPKTTRTMARTIRSSQGPSPLIPANVIGIFWGIFGCDISRKGYHPMTRVV